MSVTNPYISLHCFLRSPFQTFHIVLLTSFLLPLSAAPFSCCSLFSSLLNSHSSLFSISYPPPFFPPPANTRPAFRSLSPVSLLFPSTFSSYTTNSKSCHRGLAVFPASFNPRPHGPRYSPDVGPPSRCVMAKRNALSGETAPRRTSRRSQESPRPMSSAEKSAEVLVRQKEAARVGRRGVAEAILLRGWRKLQQTVAKPLRCGKLRSVPYVSGKRVIQGRDC